MNRSYLGTLRPVHHSLATASLRVTLPVRLGGHEDPVPVNGNLLIRELPAGGVNIEFEFEATMPRGLLDINRDHSRKPDPPDDELEARIVAKIASLRKTEEELLDTGEESAADYSREAIDLLEEVLNPTKGEQSECDEN
jgi:hypothetical protein